MSKKINWGTFFIDVMVVFVSILAGIGVSKFIVFRASVDGCSMEPTYYDGDICYALVQEQPQRGDVVVVEVEGYSLYLIKRVVGMPGETIQIINSKVYVNGEEYTEDYIADGKYTSGIAEDEVLLGINEYFVLGDNRPVSNDSRFFGSISRSQIKGVVIR